MYLRKIKDAPCQPISLDEVRQHLAVDATSTGEDDLIKVLIASATADAEMKTGRIFVESEWEWKPDDLQMGVKVEFPTCPVTKVQIFKDAEMQEEISGEVCDIVYPSPEPQGTPLKGWLLPTAVFPSTAVIVLTVGYPYEMNETPQEQKDNPVLDVAKTTYTSDKIHLVFSRPIEGLVEPENFTVTLDGVEVPVKEVVFSSGGVTLTLEVPLESSNSVQVSFIEGLINDQFGNFVQPIVATKLPPVVIGTEQDFASPDPVPVEVTYQSLCPAPVKQWILVRTGTLYSQRTEIALRGGKSNDALYPDGFINNLLNPYRVRFA